MTLSLHLASRAFASQSPITLLGYAFSTGQESRLQAGKYHHDLIPNFNHEIVIYKSIDAFSPHLFLNTFAGQAFPLIKITYENTNQHFLLQYEIENAMVSEYQAFLHENDLHIESIAFNYTAITMRYLSPQLGRPQAQSAKKRLACHATHESQLTHQTRLKSDEGFKLFVATVYGEAAGQSEAAWQAIASVIVNRVHNKRFVYKKNSHLFRFENTDQVIKISRFDAYSTQSPLYKEAIHFLNNTNSRQAPPRINELIKIIKPIYYENKTTTSAELYYSPHAQHALHIKYPKKYNDKPDWQYSEIKRVYPPNIKPNDDFMFYQYK